MKDATCMILDALQERFMELPSQCSPEQPMFDAQGREYLVVYRTIPTSLDGKKGAIASNLPNFRTNEEYPPAFQARDLSAIGESSKIRKIASKLDPTRLLVASGDPTIGSPVVWTDANGKSYVLGGNGRTIAFLIASDERYKDYVNEATQRWFNVYDSTSKKGYRNLLVRDVFKADGSPLSLKEAVQLAGASQESTAGKETPLRQALSRARGMGITEDIDLGIISSPMILTPYSVLDFVNKNTDFFRNVLSLVPDYIRVQIQNVDEQTKGILFDTIASVLVGKYLPQKFVQGGFGSEREEEAVISALPSLVALRQGIESGKIYPQYDLLSKLETARDFMAMNRNKSYSDALADYERDCKNQSSFMEPTEVCKMNTLGVSFGLYLKRMVQSADPSKGVKDIKKYIEKGLDEGLMYARFVEPTEDELEEEATTAFAKLALPPKLAEKVLQNPSDEVMNTDRIIIEALQKRFDNIASEEGKKIYDKVIQRWSKWHKSNWESLTKTGIRLETGDVLIAQRDVFTQQPSGYITKGSIVEVGEASSRGDTTGYLIDGTHFTWDSNKALQSLELKPSTKIRKGFRDFNFGDGFRGGEAPYILGHIDQSVWKIKKEAKPEKTKWRLIFIEHYKGDPTATKKLQDKGLELVPNLRLQDTVDAVSWWLEGKLEEFTDIAKRENRISKPKEEVTSIKPKEEVTSIKPKEETPSIKPKEETPSIKPKEETPSIKPKKEDSLLKPYRVAPSVSDIAFVHDEDGTKVELLVRQSKDAFKKIISILKDKSRHGRWNFSRNLEAFVPSPRASRANIGEEYPQNFIINRWKDIAKGLIEEGLQVFVSEEIDPRLDSGYLLEYQDDVDNLIDYLSKKQDAQIKEQEIEQIEKARDSKTIVISDKFPVCRYMKTIIRPDKYASNNTSAKQLKCPIGTFSIEQNRPSDVDGDVYNYIRYFEKEEDLDEYIFYMVLGRLSTMLYEGQKNKAYPLSAPFYDVLIETYYKSIGYEVCRTSVKGGVSGAGLHTIYLDENALLTESGYGTKAIRPIVYLPFPTKEDLLEFTELQVPKLIEKAKSKEKPIVLDVQTFENVDFSFPVSSILSFQLHENGEYSYVYRFEVLGRFVAHVLNFRGKVFTFLRISTYPENNIVDYPYMEITTDPHEMDLIDNAIKNCEKVSEKYLEEKTKLEAKKSKTKPRKKKTITMFNVSSDGVATPVDVEASKIGDKFGIIKQYVQRGKYFIVYLPTGSKIKYPARYVGWMELRMNKLKDATEVWKKLEANFVAPDKKYPKGITIEDEAFYEALKKAVPDFWGFR